MKPYSQRWSETLPRLKDALDSPPIEATKVYFFAENMAWITIEAVNEVCYEKRWGVPSKETSGFDLLVKNEVISLEEGRRLKQIAEYRNLSHRDFSVLSLDEIAQSVREDIPRVEALFRTLASC